jgi:predicted TIM-barrel fold metal-dependent hydrolase
MERIDCHCHIFNIVTVGWRVILEQLHDVASPHDKSVSERGVKDKIGKIALLIKAFTENSEHIFEMLDKEYDKKYKLFALMFDGDFLLNAFVKRQLREINRHIRDSCTIQGKKTEEKAWNRSGSSKWLSDEETDIQLVLNFLDEMSGENKTKGIRSSQKDGFTIQYEQIRGMAENPKYRDRLIPFLGVDPRRKDIKDWLSMVGKEQLFAGIKVYPPNGFSPFDKVLAGPGSVFEYCSKNGIPVVSHCSYGGFATPVKSIDVNGLIIPRGKKEPVAINGKYTFRKGLRDGFGEMVRERAAVLNHPKIWEEVLKKYKNLILVLAHFGVGDNEWQDEILRMMKTYKNLYTDVSCISDESELQRIKEIFLQNPKIQDKILYGSDFFLDLFFNDSFSQYKERMEVVFGEEIFDKLSLNNPDKFMSKWY